MIGVEVRGDARVPADLATTRGLDPELLALNEWPAQPEWMPGAGRP